MRYYAAIMCVTLLERGGRRGSKLAQKDARAGGRQGIPLPVGNYAARGLGALGGLAGAWQRRHSDTTTTLFVA